MSFLRRFGGKEGSTGSAAGNGTPAAEVREWFNETPGERYYGMENFGNTCYANSVLQSLYFSKPFRELVEAYLPDTPASTTSPPPSFSPSPSSPLLPQGSRGVAQSPSIRRPNSSAGVTLAGGNKKSTPPPRPGTSAGRATISSAFGGHKRQESGPLTSSASSAADTGDAGSVGSPPRLEGGTPLAQTSTMGSMGSFTGVGSPTFANGSLIPPNMRESTLLTTLHDLFIAISTQQKPMGTVAPQAFINQLKRDNEFFRSTLHQDAHEFFNYLVNMIAEAVEKEEKKKPRHINGRVPGEDAKTWVHRLFEGILTNETRCLTCETVTSRDEAFLDLSIDIEANSSVTACLRQFSASEMLCQRNKFSCDKCCGLQEAEKRMKIKKLPNILALHLKRFKYEESLQRHVKLTYRVVFPFELRLFNTADGASNPDRLYELWAIVVHIGVGPHHGHYISVVKSGDRWIVFDDHSVYPIEESDIQKYFGDTPGYGSGYVLFYQAVDLDIPLQNVVPQPAMQSAAFPSAATELPGSNPLQVNPSESSSGLGLQLGLSGDSTALEVERLAAPSEATSKSSLVPPPLTPLDTATVSSSESSYSNGVAHPPTASDLAASHHGTPGALSPAWTSAPKEKEKESGWTIRGKNSVTSRIGRSLSLASNGKEQPSGRDRVVSSPNPPATLDVPPPLPTSVSGTDFVSSPIDGNPVDFLAPSSSSTLKVATSQLSPAAAHNEPEEGRSPTTTTPPRPPSEDGSASTTSASTGAGFGLGFSKQRRGSKASADLSASTHSASAPPPPVPASRGLFGRKNSIRPVSLVGPSTSLLVEGRKEQEKRLKEDRKRQEKEAEREAKEKAKRQKEADKLAKKKR